MPVISIANQTRDLIQFRLEDLFPLRHIPVIEMRPGDFSLPFCPMAVSLLNDPLVGRVRIEKADGKQFISIGRNLRAAMGFDAPANFNAIKSVVEAAASGRAPILNEEELLRTANAEVAISPNNPRKDFPSFIAAFMHNSLMPLVRQRTGHANAEIRLSRILQSDQPINDLGVTLHNSCASCTASVMATLDFAAWSIQKKVFSEVKKSKKMGGFVVLPTRTGSPSFTHRPPRQVIDSEVFRQPSI